MKKRIKIIIILVIIINSIFIEVSASEVKTKNTILLFPSEGVNTKFEIENSTDAIMYLSGFEVSILQPMEKQKKSTYIDAIDTEITKHYIFSMSLNNDEETVYSADLSKVLEQKTINLQDEYLINTNEKLDMYVYIELKSDAPNNLQGKRIQLILKPILKKRIISEDKDGQINDEDEENKDFFGYLHEYYKTYDSYERLIMSEIIFIVCLFVTIIACRIRENNSYNKINEE